MITKLKPLLLIVMLFTVSSGQKSDVDAINKIIDNYSKTEYDGKLLEQAKLMTDDRVWIGLNGLGRMTNQSLNMNIQQFQSDAFQKSINGIKWFSDARDRLIKFYGDGKVAVASFYWYRSFVLPPNTNSETRNIMNTQPDPMVVSMVLEKRKGNWKIVHTHNSSLVKTNNN